MVQLLSYFSNVPLLDYWPITCIYVLVQWMYLFSTILWLHHEHQLPALVQLLSYFSDIPLPHYCLLLVYVLVHWIYLFSAILWLHHEHQLAALVQLLSSFSNNTWLYSIQILFQNTWHSHFPATTHVLELNKGTGMVTIGTPSKPKYLTL